MTSPCNFNGRLAFSNLLVRFYIVHNIDIDFKVMHPLCDLLLNSIYTDVLYMDFFLLYRTPKMYISTTNMNLMPSLLMTFILLQSHKIMHANKIIDTTDYQIFFNDHILIYHFEQQGWFP